MYAHFCYKMLYQLINESFRSFAACVPLLYLQSGHLKTPSTGAVFGFGPIGSGLYVEMAILLLL